MASEARFIARQFGNRLLYSGIKRTAQGAFGAGVAGMAYAVYKRMRPQGGRIAKRSRIGSRGRKSRQFRGRRSYGSRGRRMKVSGTREERRVTFKSGSRATRRQTVQRTLRAAVTPSVYFFKGLSQEFKRSGPGYYESGRQGPATGVFNWPVRAFNLTTIIQGTAVTPNPLKRLLSDVNNRFYWQNETGLDNIGVTSTALNPRNTVNISSSGLYHPKSLLDWVRMRFVFFSPTTRPIKYFLQIVRFEDDELAPEFQSGVNSPLTANNDLNEWAVNHVRRLTSNPIANSGIRGTQKKMTVIASKTIVMETPLTDDADTNTQRRVVDWFYKPAKIVNFYDSRTVTTSNPTTGTSTFAETGAASLLGTPAMVKDRLYLLISAEAFERFGQAGDFNLFDPTIHGSYDMNIELGYKGLDQS